MSKELSKLIKNMRAMLPDVKTHEDLHKIIQLAVDYGRPVKYNNAPLYILTVALLAAVLITKYFYAYHVVIFALLMFVSLFPAMIALARKSALKTLEKQIFMQDAFMDNGITAAEAPGFGELDRRYADFNRGNHTRDIEYYMQGRLKKDEYELDYAVYKFHYVVKRQTTDSKGKSKTTYTSYYRYGLILKDFTCAGMQIMQSQIDKRFNTRWTTSSIKFNKLFKVYVADEMEAARFFKPVVVLGFEEFSGCLPKLNVEVDADRRLCISFDKCDLLEQRAIPSLENPHAFMKALEGQASFPMLNKVLDFLYTLMIKTDNNFQRS